MERRSRKRYSKRLPVSFGKDRPDKIGFTDDLSVDSVFIKSSVVYPPGTALFLQITLPDNQVVDLTGRVMWAKQVPAGMIRVVKKAGMGIRLTGISDAYGRYIASLQTAGAGNPARSY